jgi:Stage II sporulation protein E (SpoIIE)
LQKRAFRIVLPAPATARLDRAQKFGICPADMGRPSQGSRRLAPAIFFVNINVYIGPKRDRVSIILPFFAEYERFMEIGKARMAQFLPLGLAIPEDNPDRNRYLSMATRTRKMDSSDVAEITLMSPRDILFLYTDGVYDGSDEQDRIQIERVIREHRDESAKDICFAHALNQDDYLKQISEQDRVDDKTAFVIKRR